MWSASSSSLVINESRVILAVEVLIKNKVCERDGCLKQKELKTIQRITSLLR